MKRLTTLCAAVMMAAMSFAAVEYVSTAGMTTNDSDLTGPAQDETVYPVRHATSDFAGYTLKNEWIFANTYDNYSDNLPGPTDFVRGMAVKDGIMYFINRDHESFTRVDGATGEMLDPLPITGEHLFEAQGEDGTWSSCVTLKFNDVKVDNAGNLLIGGISQGGNRFQIYKVDSETGAATMIINDRIYDHISDFDYRFDAFGVYGDVNGDAVIMAASWQSWHAFRWNIKGGQWDGNLDIITLKPSNNVPSLFTRTENGVIDWSSDSPGTAPHILPLENGSFYIDGWNTLPMLFSAGTSQGNGRFISYELEDFAAVPTGLVVTNNEGEECSMNFGHNGLTEFKVGDEYFLLMAATNTIGSPKSAFALYKYKDAAKSFAEMEPMWFFPANGMGTATNGCRVAVPSVEVNGTEAKLYLYTNNNGYAVYTFTGKEKGSVDTPPTSSENIWPIYLDYTTSYNYFDQIVYDFRPNYEDQWFYIWDGTYNGYETIGQNFYRYIDYYLSLKVGSNDWAGAGFYISNSTGVQAAKELCLAMIAHPEEYYLHFAIKSTDNYSHTFYIFNNESTMFTLGSNNSYGGEIYGDFTRDGQWQEFYIPATYFASKLNINDITSDLNIFVMLSEGVQGAQLNLDAIYFCKSKPIDIYSGKCGDNLYWELQDGKLFITGSGPMYNYNETTIPFRQIADEIRSVSFPADMTTVGDYAFYGCKNITSINIPQNVTTIGEYSFAECSMLSSVTIGAGVTSICCNAFLNDWSIEEIYCYPYNAPTACETAFGGMMKEYVYLYVQGDRVRHYQLNPYFTDFDIRAIGAETVPSDDDVVVIPSERDAQFTWPANGNASSYTLQITKDGEVFCTLVFNEYGQLTGIAFAPARNGEHHPRQAATATTNGWQFTVTGLNEGSAYAYTLDVKDAANKVLDSYNGTFRTEGGNDDEDDDNKGNGGNDGEEPVSWTLSVSSNNAEWGTVTGAGTYEDGTEATIEAIPAPGYRFLYWNDHKTTNPRTVLMTEDATYTAYFDRITQGTDDLSSDTFAHPCKVIENGNVYILLPDGRKLNMQGAEVK